MTLADNQGKFSVIIPVFNSAEFLTQCLDSICRQTYKNLEIICIDDGSEDNSIELLRGFQDRDSRIHVICTPNSGVSAARNRGLQECTGDYVLFIDSDDWLNQYACKEIEALFSKEAPDVVLFNHIKEYKHKSVTTELRSESVVVFNAAQVKQNLLKPLVGISGNDLKYPERADALSPVWGKAYLAAKLRSEQLEFTSLQEIGTFEDGLFNIKFFALSQKAIYINKALYHYRKTNYNSITSVYKKNLKNQWDVLFEYIAIVLRRHGFDSGFDRALRNRKVLSVIGLGLNEISKVNNLQGTYLLISDLIDDQNYQKNIKDLDISKMPVHWKVFFYLVRRKRVAGVVVLLWMVQKLRGSQ